MICYASWALFVYNIQKTFDISLAFLRVTIAELSTLKQVCFFGPPCTTTLHKTMEVFIAPWHKTNINGSGPVSGQHVNLLHQKATADDEWIYYETANFF